MANALQDLERLTMTAGDESFNPFKEIMVANMKKSRSSQKLLFVKLTLNASAPVKASKYAAGYDLRSAHDVVLPKRGSVLVKTDIQIQLPHGTYGRIAPRSGLDFSSKIDVFGGVINEDYRGNVGVTLINHGDEDFPIAKGDPIAQLICEKIEYPDVMEVEDLENPEPGAECFGLDNRTDNE